MRKPTGAAALEYLVALCDFIGGSSLREIARRYRWTAGKTEANLRRGFIEYALGNRRRELRLPPGAVVGIERRRMKPSSPRTEGDLPS